MERLLIIYNTGLSNMLNILKTEKIINEDLDWSITKTVVLLVNDEFEDLELKYIKMLNINGQPYNNKIRILSHKNMSDSPFLKESEIINNYKWNYQKPIKNNTIYLYDHFVFSNWIILKNPNIIDEVGVQTWIRNKINNYDKVSKLSDDKFWSLLLYNLNSEMICNNFENILIKQIGDLFLVFIPDSKTTRIQTEYCKPFSTNYLIEPFRNIENYDKDEKIKAIHLTLDSSRVVL